MSGNVATCLMSMTWLTAKLICTRALARIATPISCTHVTKKKKNVIICTKRRAKKILAKKLSAIVPETKLALDVEPSGEHRVNNTG